MKRQRYEQSINASREQVWKVMWNDRNYPEWTAPFAEGSRAETDWQEGSRIIFLNGEGEGMISKIKTREEPELMVFQHLGMVDKEGKEDFDSDKVKKWAGAEEIYHYRTENGNTTLEVEMDVDEEYKDYFEKVWPQALQKVKELAEKK